CLALRRPLRRVDGQVKAIQHPGVGSVPCVLCEMSAYHSESGWRRIAAPLATWARETAPVRTRLVIEYRHAVRPASRFVPPRARKTARHTAASADVLPSDSPAGVSMPDRLC